MSDIDNDINDNTTSIIDLVKYAHEDHPSKMQDVFNELMNNRIYDAIQQKKVDHPDAYIRATLDHQRKWLPVFYYVKHTSSTINVKIWVTIHIVTLALCYCYCFY